MQNMSLLRPLAIVCRAAAAAPNSIRIRPSNPSVVAVATSNPSIPTYRCKHSATQVKRLFKKNPARLRLLKKKGNLSSPAPKIPDRAYPPIFKPTFLGDGWSAPPPPEVQVPEYPFRVTRTGNKPFGAVGYLPVYRDIR